MRGWLRAIGVALAVVWVAAAEHAIRRAQAAAPDETPRAPARLAETGLYEAGRVGVIDPGNRPFAPQYALWSDGAAKRRWVYLPPHATIDASVADEWEFPVGTRFWKEFSFAGRKVETRLMWRASSSRWVFASYRWNPEQTDAVLAHELGEPGVAAVAPGRSHGIPAVADCLVCHGEKRPTALGFSALQLSPDRDPLAIHGETVSADMVTLTTLMAERRLSPDPAALAAAPPRIRTANPETRAALGYLAANCGGCHNGRGEIAALGPTLVTRDLVADGDAVARALVGQKTKWQVPGRPDGTSMLIDPDSPEQSAILVRMRSRQPSSQMPPLGTVLRDQAALDHLTRWVASQAREPR